MPQNGFHGLVGLAVARQSASRVPPAVAERFVTGVVLGAMLPDIDMFPTAISFLTSGSKYVYALHRTFTHSLLAILLAAGFGLFAGLQKRERGWLWYGLALGMVTHAFLDFFMWFAPLDLFWPFSHLPPGSPLLPILNLWPGGPPRTPIFGNPDFLVNLREALEFAAFAVYLFTLRRILKKENASEHGLRKWEAALWIFFVIALGTAALLKGKSQKYQEILCIAPYLLAFLPYCWYATWRHRAQLTRWAMNEQFKSRNAESAETSQRTQRKP